MREIEIISHEGRIFENLGAVVEGRRVVGYTALSENGRISLATWHGSVILGRGETVERFANGESAIVFRLPKGRYVAGYALGGCGSLFRGELLPIDGSLDDAKRSAKYLSDHFAELDAVDEWSQWRLLGLAVRNSNE